MRERDTSERPDWRLVLLVWLVAAALLGWRFYAAPGSRPLFNDTDDAMRMVVVRDLLAGQGWWDLVQHRLNTPYGAELHWSRLVALGQAGLLVVLRPLLGGAAETVLGYLWPALLLLPLVWLGAALSMRLAGRGAQLPGLVLPAMSPAVYNEFVPGRLDHHNLQILLALGLALTVIKGLERPGWALAAGVIGATGLAIGIEALPLVVAAAAGIGLAYVLDGTRARALAFYGSGFGGATLIHLAIARPPGRWLEPACDMISATYALAGLLMAGATLLLALPAIAGRGWPVRLAAGVATAGAAVAVMVLLFPECRGGPYQMLDPWLLANWIKRITEAKPILASFTGFPAYVLSTLVPVGLALVGVLAMLALSRGTARRDWLVYGVMLAVAVAVMLMQVRAARIAAPLAVGGGAGLIVLMRGLYLERKKLWAALPLMLAWLGSAGLLVSMATTALMPRATGGGTPAPSKIPCLMAPAFADLAALPPMRVMTPVDLGAHMLLETPHAVIAAPYHRNGQGVLDAFRVLNAPEAEARAILLERGIGLVVTCPAMNEMRGLGDAAPDALVRQLREGRLPDWLSDQSLPGSPLKVYAVAPAAAETPVPTGQETPVPARPQ